MRSRERFTASPVLWALLLGTALGVGLAACASQSRMMQAAELDQRKKEIQEYWTEIEGWDNEIGRKHLKLGTSPSAVGDGPKCETTREPSTETCQDVCNLKDAICDNAESICRIQKQLPGDGWAANKCENATRSCKEARQKCCQCTVEEQASAIPAPLDRKP